MNLFIVVSSSLGLLALAFLLPSLLHQRAKATAIASLLLLPLGAIAIYLTIGTPQALQPAATVATDAAPTMEQMVDQLQAHLVDQPDDARAWFMLGRAFSAQQQFSKSADAFEHAMSLSPNDPVVIAELAGATLLSSGSDQASPHDATSETTGDAIQTNRIPARVGQLLDRALSIEPNQQKALWLRGTLAFQTADYASALTDWTTLQSLIEPGSAVAETLTSQIQQAQALVAQQPSDQTGVAAITDLGRSSIEVTVELAPELTSQFSTDDVLFVYAEPGVGRPMPIAVSKLTTVDLPMTLSLDDSMAMVSNRKLSDFPQFVVRARLSKSGNAIPQPGDLHGAVSVTDQQETVTVTIDSVR